MYQTGYLNIISRLMSLVVEITFVNGKYQSVRLTFALKQGAKSLPPSLARQMRAGKCPHDGDKAIAS